MHRRHPARSGGDSVVHAHSRQEANRIPSAEALFDYEQIHPDSGHTALRCRFLRETVRYPGYAGEDLSSKVTVSRDREEKTAVLTVTLPGEWELYAGAAPETIDLSAPILTGSGAGSYTLPVPAGTRSYFQFETGGNRAILAERQLPMSGGFNMRDLGGYRTSDGRHVKWGRIIRSDDLHSLTNEDLAYLASIPVKTVADFRSLQEVRAMPDKLSPQE